MLPLDLLSRVCRVDDQGKPINVEFLAVPTLNGWRHYRVQTLPELITKAHELSDSGHNVYFSCAGFKTEAGGRKATNAAGANSFWIDIDCGASKAGNNQGYATQLDALEALKSFCNAVGLPRPSVVSSGNGLHCYWTFREFIRADEWKTWAKKLKKLIHEHGLLADPARTADIASVLRVPGTKNWKDRDNPKPVQILKVMEADDLQAFIAALQEPDADAPNNPPSSGPKPNGFPKSSATKIILHCPTLAYVADCQGKVSEPLWRAMLGVVKSTVEGETRCHDWSKGDPRYDPDQTRDKIDRWTGGPTLCETFRSLPDAKCHTCLQKCKSPIQLGYIENLSAMEAAEEELNLHHFVAKVGGRVFVFDEREKPLLGSAMTFEAFRQFYGDQWVDGKSVAATWLKSPRRRKFDSLTFDPSGQKQGGSYNTWSGMEFEPAPGACRLILRHIFKVWCSRDPHQFKYVIKWMALLVQKPWLKPEVALVLRSEEGVGKTMIVQMLLDWFGLQAFTTSQKSQVAGQFNGHLFDKVLVVLQEAFFAGDPTAVAALKTLITDPEIGYEAKYQAAFSARNYAHVICLTNHEWAVPAGPDARRWMVLDVSDARKGNHAYFAALAGEIKNGGSAAFLDMLKHVNLDGFNPRILTKSRALEVQMRETMMRTDPVKSWWLHVLSEGAFSVDGGSIEWGPEISAGELRRSCEDFIKQTRSALPWDAAAKRLRQLLPAGTLTKHRKSHQGDRYFSYALPDLKVARAHFKQITGVDPCLL